MAGSEVVGRPEVKFCVYGYDDAIKKGYEDLTIFEGLEYDRIRHKLKVLYWLIGLWIASTVNSR